MNDGREAVPRASLLATVDRIEEDERGQELAVLVFDDGQELIVPRNQVPWLRREMVVRVVFEPSPEDEQERRAEIARLQARLFGESEA